MGTEIRDLIRRMSRANPLWGAPRIHGELLKLGLTVSQATVSKYMLRSRRPPSQAWRTFFKNHAKDLIALDFFTVPTATFRVLVVLVVLRHDCRRLVHFNVTEHPTAEWTARQLLEVCVHEEAPRYLIRDRDQVYGARFCRQAETLDIREVVIAPRSPWQNAYAERVIGSIRRECLDHVVVMGERHLLRILSKYLAYYNETRTHFIAGQGRARAAQCAATSSGKGGGGSSRRWASSRIFAASGVSRSTNKWKAQPLDFTQESGPAVRIRHSPADGGGADHRRAEGTVGTSTRSVWTGPRPEFAAWSERPAPSLHERAARRRWRDRAVITADVAGHAGRGPARPSAPGSGPRPAGTG